MSDNETFDPTKVQAAIREPQGQPSAYTIARARDQWEQDRKNKEFMASHAAKKLAQREAHERLAASQQVAAADKWFEASRSGWSGVPRPAGPYAEARLAELRAAEEAERHTIYLSTTAAAAARTAGGRI